MTDEQIQEIYALARESFFGGQKDFQLQAFPFRMTALNMAKHRNNPNFAFWKMLKEGYDHFDATKQEPKVAVCEKRYVFDPAAPDGATKPLSFNPKGACPAYQLDKNVAEAVLDHRRQEQYKMAQHIAEGVSTVAMRHGVDGGMNPVFASKLGTQEAYDNKGNLVRVATAPGALPRANAPATTVTVPQAAPESAPVVLANVPAPRPAPQAKEGVAPEEKPTSIAGLIGNMFGGAKEETTSEDLGAPALRGTNTDMAAKPKRAPVYQTASQPKPQEAAKPKAVAAAAPVAKPQQQATPAARDNLPSAPAQEMRTAYSAAPPPPSGGMLTGAQPVVPTGTFASRWSAGFR
jgi:hypothetical protein